MTAESISQAMSALWRSMKIQRRWPDIILPVRANRPGEYRRFAPHVKKRHPYGRQIWRSLRAMRAP